MGSSHVTLSNQEHGFMARAIELAARGRGRTSPNPIVGCVLVRSKKIVGEGYHRKIGGAHAEVEALRVAGDQAKGATAYITLEPCNHHGRTPPCTDALIAAGVKRVVVGIRDPNPVVSGRGLRRLRAAGIDVSVGLCASACKELIADYLVWRNEARPMITLKIAQSLDGRVATASGESQWITGDAARKHGHMLRAQHDAMMVGVGTVLADDPKLTCRVRGGRDPTRIVLDTHARTPVDSHIVRAAKTSKAPTWIVLGEGAPQSRVAALSHAGVHVITCELGLDGRVELNACLKALAARDILSVLVEGGPCVSASMLRADVVDRIMLYQAPMFLGAPGKASVGDVNIVLLNDVMRFTCVQTQLLGDDVLLEMRRW